MFQYLSNLTLKVDVDFVDTTSWGKLFQILITLELKKCCTCLTVVLTLDLYIWMCVLWWYFLVGIYSSKNIVCISKVLVIHDFILQLNRFFVVCNIGRVIVIGLI